MKRILAVIVFFAAATSFALGQMSVPGRPLFLVTCSSQRLRQCAPQSSSCRRGLGQGRSQ